VAPAQTAPRPPRLPTDLRSVDTPVLDDDVLLSDMLVCGDLSGGEHADVLIERCRIANAAFIGSGLPRLRLIDVVVENVDLSGADLDASSLSRVEFRNCRMSGVIFTRCRFADVTVTDCRLDRANLRMSEFRFVTFEDVDLSGGEFYGGALEHVRFLDCNLAGSEFSKSRSVGVRFHGSNLLDLKGAQYLGGSTIEMSQALSLGLEVLSALDITVDDDRGPDPEEPRDPRPR